MWCRGSGFCLSGWCAASIQGFLSSNTGRGRGGCSTFPNGRIKVMDRSVISACTARSTSLSFQLGTIEGMRPCFSHMMGLFFSGPLCLIEGGEIRGTLQRFWDLGDLICHLSFIFWLHLKFANGKRIWPVVFVHQSYCCAAGFSLHGPETTAGSSIGHPVRLLDDSWRNEGS